MFDNAGELLTFWTARLAVLCYLAALLSMTRTSRPFPGILWASGAVLTILHLCAAFQFSHHWSHDEAWEHTAGRTAELFGLRWGGGVWFNYAFTILWSADALWWTLARRSYAARPRWLSGIVHAFLAFMVFNATVVFGSRWWIAVAAVFAALAARNLRRRPGKSN